MAGKYPIVKYPKNIERKLKSRSVIVPKASPPDIDEDAFAYLFPPPPVRKARKYPQYLLWGLMGLWVIMLGGIIVKAISAGVLIAAVAISSVVVAVAGKQLWADSKIQVKQVDRTKSLSPPTKGEVKSSVIDWTENVSELVRSRKKSLAQVGASEGKFLEKMQRTLPGKISFGHEYLPEGYNHPYSADIEIILSCGLGIQVEIDEPYVMKSREPHHCWDNGKDTKRDVYFTGIGWVIIRFSEKQIVTDPNGCCGAIAKLMFDLTQDTTLTKIAELADKLKPDPQWSAQQSALMEKIKVREKYLASSKNDNGKKQ